MPWTHPGLYVGSVTFDFDPALLAYQPPLTITSPVVLQSGPTTGSAGGHSTVTVGFSNATDHSELGRIKFKAIGTAGSNATVGLSDPDTFIGSFISKLPVDHPFYPSFTGKTVLITAVPLPAAAWLFGCALGALGLRRRRA